MPTVFILFGFIFKFYSDDHEPIHVHVETAANKWEQSDACISFAEREQARPKVKDGHEAKYNVEPEVTQVYNHGFKKSEIKMIESVIEENVEVIIDRWKTYFGQE